MQLHLKRWEHSSIGKKIRCRTSGTSIHCNPSLTKNTQKFSLSKKSVQVTKTLNYTSLILNH